MSCREGGSLHAIPVRGHELGPNHDVPPLAGDAKVDLADRDPAAIRVPPALAEDAVACLPDELDDERWAVLSEEVIAAQAGDLAPRAIASGSSASSVTSARAFPCPTSPAPPKRSRRHADASSENGP